MQSRKKLNYTRITAYVLLTIQWKHLHITILAIQLFIAKYFNGNKATTNHKGIKQTQMRVANDMRRSCI